MDSPADRAMPPAPKTAVLGVTTMTALPNAIRKGLTFFAILGAATFLVAACGGGGGGGEPIKPPPIKPPPGKMKIVPNGAPTTKGSIPDRTLGVGGRAVIDLSGYFADPNGDSLTYRLTYRPSRNSANVRASVSGNSLLIRGVASPGVTVRVTARDPGGLSAYQDIDVSVKALVENRAPTARGSIPDRTLEVGESYTIDLSGYFTDPDGDRLTYRLDFSSGHDGNVRASVSGDELQIQGVASPGANVRVTASDPSGRTAYQDFAVNVSAVGSGQPVPDDPLDDVNVQISSSCPRQVQICVRDNACEDGDRISVSVNGAQLFSGELFNAAHCFNAPVREGANAVSVLALNGTGYKGACDHPNANTGEIRINGQAQGWRHPARAGSRANINVTIGPAGGSCSPGSGTGRNSDPVARGSIPNQTLEVGGRETIDLSRYFTDPDGDRLTYQLRFSSGQRDNVRASVSGNRLEIQGAAPPGATVRVIASDPSGRWASQDFTVTVRAQRSRQFVSIAGGYRETRSGGVGAVAWATGTGNSASAAERDASNRCATLLSASCALVGGGTTYCISLAYGDERMSTGNGRTRVASRNSAVAACRRASPSSPGTCAVPTGDGGLATICGSDGR